ncbi:MULTISPECIES: hypothetical protein [Bacillaceae]|uniref:hypothetical protein n=1 Tax=Bacillaceae TaxID=186817 RepID=UPI000BFC96A3|nr:MULTISPECIES: hypothetical protein [Bacillaceae]PGT82760.1 hypothetical protein COD11_14150 [Bacillus sp. AFS040349]UGB33083.1 hypothetical protein LPC09_11980 [Metabacillus sp. B2-18]
MKKLAAVLLVLLISACSINEPSSSNTQVLTHEFEENGIALEATIEVDKEIKLNASITNTSKESIIYNGRCGIPFMIFIKKEDAHLYLVRSNGDEVNCESVFDPKDLKKMEPNETFEKQVTFKREVNFTNQSTVQALNGMYEVSFSFQKHENEPFVSLIPLELNNDQEPEIFTVEQAKERAKEKEEVKKWFEEHQGEGMSIESEDSILNDGMWTVIFRAVHKDGADRIIINLDAKSGEFGEVHYENIGLETLKLLNE